MKSSNPEQSSGKRKPVSGRLLITGRLYRVHGGLSIGDFTAGDTQGKRTAVDTKEKESDRVDSQNIYRTEEGFVL
jgi:hypothetical protein